MNQQRKYITISEFNINQIKIIVILIKHNKDISIQVKKKR